MMTYSMLRFGYLSDADIFYILDDDILYLSDVDICYILDDDFVTLKMLTCVTFQMLVLPFRC